MEYDGAKEYLEDVVKLVTNLKEDVNDELIPPPPGGGLENLKHLLYAGVSFLTLYAAYTTRSEVKAINKKFVVVDSILSGIKEFLKTTTSSALKLPFKMMLNHLKSVKKEDLKVAADGLNRIL